MSLEENIQQLRDALDVNSGATLAHERRLKDHREWLEAHEQAMAALAHGMKLHNEAMRALDETAVAHDQWLREHEQSMARLDEKLQLIADLILKGRGENGKK